MLSSEPEHNMTTVMSSGFLFWAQKWRHNNKKCVFKSLIPKSKKLTIRFPEARIVVRGRIAVGVAHHGGITVRSLRQYFVVYRQDHQCQRQGHRYDLQVERDPPRDVIPRPIVIGLQGEQAGCRQRKECSQHHQDQLQCDERVVFHADAVPRRDHRYLHDAEYAVYAEHGTSCHRHQATGEDDAWNESTVK